MKPNSSSDTYTAFTPNMNKCILIFVEDTTSDAFSR
jgi:hypothetical protein